MSLDGLPAAHLRVLLDGLPVFERYGLLLAGGYAFRAHEILHRPSQDLDFATRDDTPLPEIAEHVRDAFQSAGYRVELVEATGRYARLTLRLPGSGEDLEMDLLKEALDPSFVTVQATAMTSVRILSLDDTVGLKARAWHDRFVIRDIIDLHAVASTFSYIDLERLARRHEPDLDLETILDHLAEPEPLTRIMKRALRDAHRCSSDPLCAERLPKAPADFLHGAACHACLFVSETTCERGNRFLDRRFVVPIDDQFPCLIPA